MATPTLVPAAWAKGKYDVYRLSRDGSFSGYMHPPGLAYLVNLDVNAHMDVDQVFLSARNQQAKGSFYILCSVHFIAKFELVFHRPCHVAFSALFSFPPSYSLFVLTRLLPLLTPLWQ